MSTHVVRRLGVGGLDERVEGPMPKADAERRANELNDKPVDGTLFVARPMSAADADAETRASADRLIAALSLVGSPALTEVPHSILAHDARRAMDRLSEVVERDARWMARRDGLV